MSDTSGPNLAEIYKEAESKIEKPDSTEYVKYIKDMMNKCIELGTLYGRSASALGNMKGHWFEMLCKGIFENEFGENNITMRVNDETNHKIKEIRGFEDVTWITYPDAIIMDEQDLKAVISVKGA